MLFISTAPVACFKIVSCDVYDVRPDSKSNAGTVLGPRTWYCRAIRHGLCTQAVLSLSLCGALGVHVAAPGAGPDWDALGCDPVRFQPHRMEQVPKSHAAGFAFGD